MKCKITVVQLTIAAVILLFSSCIIDFDGFEPGIPLIKNFDSKLQGTWVSNEPGIYSGTLVIQTQSIKITGYSENQTPSAPDGDDAKRPFKNFTKGTELSGYAEDEKIFIKDIGKWQPGIGYDYYTTGKYPHQDEFLRLEFGGRQETLKKKTD